MFNIAKISFIDDLFIYVISFILGILSYFYFSFALFIPVIFLLFLSDKWKSFLGCVLIFLFGTFIIYQRMEEFKNHVIISESLVTPILDSKVVQVNMHENEYSLILYDVKVIKDKKEVLLDKVRLKVKHPYNHDLYSGYHIAIPEVNLFQPNDISYQDFSAVGYTKFEPQVINDSNIFFFYRIYNYLDHLLDKVSAPDDVKQVIKVFLLGKSFKMENDLYEYFQKSGLAHILVISGLHIIIMGMLILNISRMLMCLNSNLALYHPIKKYSCIITIIILTIYLFLTGLSSSTERAYIVVCLNLIAIMLDKVAFGMHNLNLAALIILFFNPEQLFLPGFQLTFLAVMAILNITYYYGKSVNEDENIYHDYGVIESSDFSDHFDEEESYDNLHEDIGDIGVKDISQDDSEKAANDDPIIINPWVKKLIKYIFIVGLMSFVITLVTNIVGMYYFHMISTYVFLVNIIIIPIIVFIVMPCIIFLVILGIFGLQQLPFIILTPVITFIINLAKFCSGLDYIFIPIDNLNPFFWSIGLVCIVLAMAIKELNWKLGLGIFSVLNIIIALIFTPHMPDVYVFGNNILVKSNNSFYLASGSQDSFFVKKIVNKVKYSPCRDTVCKYNVKDKSLAVVKGRKKLTCSSDFDFILQQKTLINCSTGEVNKLSNSINSLFLE